ncbi:MULTISPECIES: phage tail protein [unclassified Providencia]|uniref:phage tail protein n=1 Tax=unclassified Providencia TaxID=2633465 RepID=UPI00234AB2A7|nr:MULTISPECIES: phage tail protein [unclassified Providencia]
MTKIFKVPFATQGDRTSIPDDVQADGAVSYTQGYSYDYERDQQTDPAAKDIEREKMNGIFHDITEAVGELQSFGFPKWATEGKPYPIRAIVYHKNKTWQSKIENNNDEPVAGTAWQELKADLSAGDINVYTKTESDQRFQPLGNYLPAGYSYSKAESDTNYQPKGNYAPAGNYALKGESYTKAEGDERYQPKGSYQPSGDYATNGTVNSKFDAANSNANNRVPNTRKVNGKQLNADISLTAGDVGAYTKAESDTRIADAKAAGTNAQNTANNANTAATNANNNANNRVPNTRKVNNKALNADISLNAGDIGTYTKAEIDSKLAAGSGLGYGQTWQNVTASRVIGTNYTNATGKPIFVSVSTNGARDTYVGLDAYVNDVLVARSVGYGGNSKPQTTIIVPSGARYKFNYSSGVANSGVSIWSELR